MAEPNPAEELVRLEAALAQGAPPRGAVLRGEERWFRRRARAAIEAAARAAGLDVAAHDAADPDFDLQGLYADLRGGSLFAGARCIVLENVEDRLKKTPDGDAPLTRALLAFLADEGRPGCVVLEARGLRADHAVARAIKKLGGPIVSFRKLYDSPPPWARAADPRQSELVGWLRALARERELALSADAALALVQSVGNDLFALEAELEKLRVLGPAAVRELAGRGAAGAPYRVAEQVLAGDLPAALLGLETLWRGGVQRPDGRRDVDDGALTAMLFGSLRNQVRRHLASASGVAPAEAGGGRFRRGPDPAELRSAAEWEALADDLAALERRSRTWGTVDQNDLVAFALRWRRRPARGRT